MTPRPITLDKAKFETALLELLAREKRVRLSAMLMRLWCGSEVPTAALRDWGAEHGFEIAPGADFAGGWEVRAVGAVEGREGWLPW